MTATLIELVSEDNTVAPDAAELHACYGVLSALWDQLMAVAMTQELSDSDDALCDMEREALLAARNVVHRHMLVTLHPGQHPSHYRVHVND